MKTDDRIKEFCVGDDLEVRRTVRGIPEGESVVEAWLTIKTNLSDSDDDAIIQKVITAAAVLGVGVIEEDGSEGSAVLRFELSSTDTLKLKSDSPYFHDVQIKTGAGKISTPFKGLTIAAAQVTVSE